MTQADHVVAMDLDSMRRRIRELESKPAPFIDEWSNQPPTNVELGYDALAVGLAPLIIPNPIRVSLITCTILDLGAGASRRAALALYRASMPDFFARDFTSSESQYLANAVRSWERIKIGPQQNTDGAPVRLAWTFAPELVLDPRSIYAIAFMGNIAGMRWRGGVYATDNRSGFQGPTQSTFGDFPAIITTKQGTDHIPVPSFTLRSMKAARLIGR